jgi:hypothetical protein
LLALFAAGTNNHYAPTFPGGIIAWIVCNSRKKQQIGGWLLFYYWQLYSGVLMTSVFFVIALESYVPENFDDHKRYLLFLVSTVPTLVIYALQVAVGTFLISVRTWDLLRLLRWLIAAEVAAVSVAVAIDATFLPDNVFLNLYTLVQEVLWLAYFFRSKRVMSVFKSHDWDVAVNRLYSRPTFGAI